MTGTPEPVAGAGFSLDGRVALVTGSSQGIGLALARALGAAGATVVLNGRRQAELDDAATTLAADGIDVHAECGDVTDDDAVASMVASVEQRVGPLDIVVNNAGVQQRAAALEFAPDDFRRMLEINLVAPFVVAQTAGRAMAARRRGKIINIGSVQSQLGRPTIVPYTASKGGLRLLTRGLCADLGPLGIQVNTLAPGYFATELTRDLVADPAFSQWVRERTPAGRWGSVDELGGPVVFLASDASSFVNGQTLFVDGGMTAVV
ncbi:MAG: glucose 1-dehydrogenase [Actinomycetota bacterium]